MAFKASWDIRMPEEEVKSELELCEPPQEYLDWAKAELGETPEVRAKKLNELREMIIERNECKPHRTDDAFLLRFLRGRYYNVKAAHRLLVNYYDFKEHHPEIFEHVNLMALKKTGDDDIITVPPYREQTGRRILLYRMGNWNPSKISVAEIFQASMVVLELAILEQRAQILGGIAMFDLGGLTLQQVYHMSPSVATMMIQIMVTHFPMKIKAIHIVNQSWIFDIIFNIFKPFLNAKMQERIFFHGDDMESLHQHIDPKHLAKRYGGVHPDYSYSDWLKYFASNATIIKELRSLGYEVDDKDVDI